MDEKNRSEQLPNALLWAAQHWEARRKETEEQKHLTTARTAFTIALSRQAGAGGTSVAREVGKQLGWTVYDHELVEHIAAEMKLRVDLLESVDEKRMSWLQEWVEAFASVPSVSQAAYVRHLLQTLFGLASHGACVIVGRGAAQVLPVQTTLRVRLVGPLEDRILATSRKRGVSKEEAARQVAAVDQERVRFVKDHFLKDPFDPEQYDLSLNSTRFSTRQCAELIVAALRRCAALKRQFLWSIKANETRLKPEVGGKHALTS